MTARPFPLAFLVLVASPPFVFSQGLILTEFMADNSKTLKDEDGDFPDWVEVFNSGVADVSLEGYYLSDDVREPTKWAFPRLTLGPKQFVSVFSSGNNLRDPALELHTNFRLANEGGNLILVAPDGRTIVSGYEKYPEQQADVSYGMASDSKFATPVPEKAPARVHVPLGPDLGLRWTELNFDDSSWRQGNTAVGFGMRSPELELVGTDVTAELKNVNSSIYIRIPFEVADPAAVDVMKLRVRYDDGFAAFVNGQLVAASSNAPADLQWNSVTPSSHVPRDYEEFNVSSAIKVLKPGGNVLAIQGVNRSASDSDLFILPELEIVDIGQIQPDTFWHFTKPTPAAPNGNGFPGAGPRPVFSLASGVYVDSQQVELTTDLPEAAIRYTLDGTLPTERSTLYAGPINITEPTRVTARVFKEGLAPGIPERNTFLILDSEAADFSTNLPLVICTTFGKQVGANCGGGPYTPGHIYIVYPNQEGRSAAIDEPGLTSGAAFRRRGASTCGYDKFAFNVEMLDPEGRDKNVDVFDFPTESDYIMFGGNNFDRSLVRNPIAYWMSREVGQWAARSKFVECFFHQTRGPITERSYFGIYAFLEKNKRHPDKIDVAQIHARDKEEPEVTGGYVLRRDRVGPDEVQISGGGYSSLVFVYPKLPTKAQQNYVTKFLNQAIGTLNANIGRQEDNQLIDFTGWIDHHILNWYPKNVDAFRLSGYFHKDREGPLLMGPVWDYDRTMGNSDDDRASKPEGWNNEQVADGGTRYFEAGGLGSWYSLLFRNQPPISNTPWNRAYRARWVELRKGPLQTEGIHAQLDAWAEELTKEAGERNTNRWPSQRPRFGGLQGEIDHLKRWLAQRADWIDSQFIAKPEFDPEGGHVVKGIQVQILMDAPATIYYTLDGTDPRAPGGKPAASARQYTGPISINTNTRIVAKARFPDESWSGPAEATYVVEIAPLMITEIMFKPLPPTPEEDPRGSATNMQFLELTNVGTEPIPLAGVAFTKGVTFSFDGSAIAKLEPGQSVVLPKNKAAFAARYGTNGILVAGEFGGSLSAQGEVLALRGFFGEQFFDFKYEPWYPEVNGSGYSLVNDDPRGPANTLEDSARWRPSDAVHGSPGRAEGLSTGGRILPGDTDRDGKLHLTDSIRILLLLFAGFKDGPCGAGGLETPASRKVLDWDGSGTVDVSDAIRNLHHLFLAGAPHAAGTQCIVVEGCEEACRQ